MAKTATAPKPAAKKASNGTKAATAAKPATTPADAAKTAATTESDKAAEAAMNAAPETTEPVVTTEGSTEEIASGEAEIADDGSIKLPPNEFNFLTEVLKSPISKERYDELVTMKLIAEDEPMDKFFEVKAEVPDIVFGDMASKKTLAQSAKASLASDKREVIKIVIAGNPSKKSVIKLLREDFSLGKNGRSTGKRRGRPPGVKSATTTTATPGKRGRKSNAERAAAAAASNQPETFASLRARLQPDPARVESMFKDLSNIKRKYGDLLAIAGIVLE